MLSGDRVVHREELNILQERLSDCVKREEVNHLQRCRPQAMAYWNSFRKYRSQGLSPTHSLRSTHSNTF